MINTNLTAEQKTELGKTILKWLTHASVQDGIDTKDFTRLVARMELPWGGLSGMAEEALYDVRQALAPDVKTQDAWDKSMKTALKCKDIIGYMDTRYYGYLRKLLDMEYDDFKEVNVIQQKLAVYCSNPKHKTLPIEKIVILATRTQKDMFCPMLSRTMSAFGQENSSFQQFTYGNNNGSDVTCGSKTYKDGRNSTYGFGSSSSRYHSFSKNQFSKCVGENCPYYNIVTDTCSQFPRD